MHDLIRFHDAQQGIFETALAELRAGRKRSHWMWFIFPQIRTLGRSSTAKYYGISDLEEARAYLADAILGPRLVDAAAAVLLHSGTPPETILGSVDALKLRSSATLFEAAGRDRVFRKILDDFYDGERCPLTVAELGI